MEAAQCRRIEDRGNEEALDILVLVSAVDGARELEELVSGNGGKKVRGKLTKRKGRK
jgi:hypothetical protein